MIVSKAVVRKGDTIMEDKYLKLEKALNLAKEAALTVVTEEVGTCNFDAPTLNWKEMGYDKKKTIAVIENVGLRWWEPYGKFWRGVFIIGGVTRGQGNLRTETAEAFSKSLKESGISSGVYYQVD